MTFGLIVVVVGAMFLLQNLGVITSAVWSLVWPSLLIVAGVSIMMKHEKKRKGDEEK
jgi:hypothetical protein